MQRFNNRTVIVTGGCSWNGRQPTRVVFVAEGANVVIADVLEQEGADARRRARRSCDLFCRLDVTSDADWAATVGCRRGRLRPGLRAESTMRGIVRFGAITGDRAGGPGAR